MSDFVTVPTIDAAIAGLRRAMIEGHPNRIDFLLPDGTIAAVYPPTRATERYRITPDGLPLDQPIPAPLRLPAAAAVVEAIATGRDVSFDELAIGSSQVTRYCCTVMIDQAALVLLVRTVAICKLA